MANRSAPTDEERLEARRSALALIASGKSDYAQSELQLFDGTRFPFPADLLTGLAADALAVAGAVRSVPVSLDQFAERYLPEYEVRGNVAHQKMRAAVNLVVATHAGVVPDYVGVAGWWQRQDLAWFSFLALVLMLRIAAERTGQSVADVCADLDASRGVW